MSDHIDELCELVKSAGGTMRLYGRPVSAVELRGAMNARVDAKLGALVGLPTPSLSATITPPVRKGELGAVVVAGYTPPNRFDGDPVPTKPRKLIICARCKMVGHNAANTKHHPRPL